MLKGRGGLGRWTEWMVWIAVTAFTSTTWGVLGPCVAVAVRSLGQAAQDYSSLRLQSHGPVPDANSTRARFYRPQGQLKPLTLTLRAVRLGDGDFVRVRGRHDER